MDAFDADVLIYAAVPDHHLGRHVRALFPGQATTASGAVATAQALVKLFHEDAARVLTLGRTATTTMRAFEAVRQRPVSTLKEISERTDLSFPAVSKAMALLADLGIVRELTGGKRNRVFAYHHYLALLSEGAEPL